MKNDNESIQEIIDSMSVGKRKYEEKKSLKKGFKSIEDYILHGLNILNKPSNIKDKQKKENHLLILILLVRVIIK